MNIKVNGDTDSMASIMVKSRSIFPDLFPLEAHVLVVSERHAMLMFDRFSAVCKKSLASLPLGDLGVIIAIFALANA